MMIIDLLTACFAIAAEFKDDNMKPCILFLFSVLTLLTILSCSRELTNPLDTDSELKQNPEIVQVYLDSSNRIVLQLGMSYSQTATIIFERKLANTFEPIACQKLSASTFADTTLNMEQNYNLSYRVKVQKGEYQTDYSPVNNYNYVSNIINAPSGVSATSIELQGIRLNWQDKSGTETGYKIEKNENGAGYTEIASLPANSTTYMHSISGMPATTLNLAYRVKAYNSGLASAWVETNSSYSGLGAPSDLRITNSVFYHFSLAWTRNSTLATGYQVERKKDSGTYTVVATLGANSETFTEIVAENGIYSYRVRAFAGNNYSTYSNEASNTINIVMPTSGLVAHYPFNGNANDASGNGNNGTVNGATLVYDRFGNADRAYGFNGVSDHIQVQNASELNPQFVSVCAWMNKQPGGGPDFPAIVTKYGGGVIGGYGMYKDYESTLGLNFGVYINAWDSYNSPYVLAENQWYFCVGVFDGQTISLYIDGVKILQSDLQGAITSSQSDLYIGCEYRVIDTLLWQFFHGSLDDIRIYNRALSEAEIQALYHEGGWTGTKRTNTKCKPGENHE